MNAKKFFLSLLALPGLLSADISFFADAFTRADEQLDASANWTKIGGAGGAELGIVSNQLQLTAAAGARRAYLSPDHGSTDGYVESTVPSLTGRGINTNNQITGRFVDIANHIWSSVTAANVPSCGSRLIDVNASWATGTPSGNVTELRLEFEGTTVRCYFDDGDGLELYHTQTGVAETGTRFGYVANLNAPGTVVWDSYDQGDLSEGLRGADDIIARRFSVDPLAVGTTYYFNSARSGTSNGTGVSDANAFYTANHLRNKNFNNGDAVLFKDDQATTLTAALLLNDSRGTATDPFYLGAYHMVSGAPVRGLSGLTPVNTPDHLGYPCLDGSPWLSSKYHGGMDNTTLMAMQPTPEPTVTGGNIYKEGTNNGLLQMQTYGGGVMNVWIEDLCFRLSGGKGLALIQAGTSVAEGMFINRIIVDSTMKQSFHASGIYELVVQNSIFTRGDGEQIYAPGAGNLQGQLTYKSLQNNPAVPQNAVYRWNLIYDSHSSECMNTNSGNNSIIFDGNVCVDTGKVHAMYDDRTSDATVVRQIMIRTSRNEWHDFEGATTDGRGGNGLVVQNEKNCGSFDWCGEYNTPADFHQYKTQQGIFAYNIVMGFENCIAYLSQASVAPEASALWLTGLPHGGGMYWYGNMCLDPAAYHFNVNAGTPANYTLDTNYPPRVWANIFWNGDTQFNANSFADRNDADFNNTGTPANSVMKNNYASSDIEVQTNYDMNLVQTGLQMPMDDYWDLRTHIIDDADGHSTIPNMRLFLEWLGVNPNDLRDRDLTRFKPTANVSSGLDIALFTPPPLMTFGYLENLDVEYKPFPAGNVLFGPFADTQGPVVETGVAPRRYYRRIIGD